MKVRLYTRPDRLTDLHRLADSGRKNSSQIKVSRDDLVRLLMDHSVLVDKVGFSNFEYHDEKSS